MNGSFSAGAGTIEPDTDSYWFEIFACTEPDTLIEFGNVLQRYTDKLRVAGRDY